MWKEGSRCSPLFTSWEIVIVSDSSSEITGRWEVSILLNEWFMWRILLLNNESALLLWLADQSVKSWWADLKKGLGEEHSGQEKKGTSGSKMWSWKENVVNMKLNTISKETVQGKVVMGTLMISVFLKSWWHHWYQDMSTNVNTILFLLSNWWFLNKRCYWPVSNICFQIDYFSILKPC